MARSLSNMLMRNLSNFSAARFGTTQVSGFSCQSAMNYSTSFPNDPDTHEDFRPASKVESSDLSVKDIVEQDVKENHVMIYMKGVPEMPRCGFSSLAVRVLKEYDESCSYEWDGPVKTNTPLCINGLERTDL